MSLLKTNQHKTLALFLTTVTGLLCALVYLGVRSSRPRSHLIHQVPDLERIVREEGIDRYFDEKDALRDQIRRILSDTSPGSEEYQRAMNLAVYLFPDLVPDNDIEREVALETWKPLQEEIEQNPKTAESRAHFEEMRADIWNYENASKAAPQLSTQAMQVIRLYDVMSTP